MFLQLKGTPWSRGKRRRSNAEVRICAQTNIALYIVGIRGKGEITTGTNHLGLRCVLTRLGMANQCSSAINVAAPSHEL